MTPQLRISYAAIIASRDAAYAIQNTMLPYPSIMPYVAGLIAVYIGMMMNFAIIAIEKSEQIIYTNRRYKYYHQ